MHLSIPLSPAIPSMQMIVKVQKRLKEDQKGRRTGFIENKESKPKAINGRIKEERMQRKSFLPEKAAFLRKEMPETALPGTKTAKQRTISADPD